MPKFVRRPFVMGNTDVPVLSQPLLRGSVPKDADGEFAGVPLPGELAVETESGDTTGGVSVVFSSDRTAAGIVAAINTTLAGYAEAEEVEGCLHLRSVGSGEGSYVRVMPPVSGLDDCSAAFGFSLHPHPAATSRAGDLADAPVRPRQQLNPPGTKYLAVGEDRLSSSFNRALNVLGINGDDLYTKLQRSVARAVLLEVDEVTHAAYVTVALDGTVEQVDLSDLSVFDADLAGKRLHVGGLSASSSLSALSRSYGVLDAAGRQLVSGDSVVRVGAVTRGVRVALMPTFASETAAPAGALPNTAGAAPDGGNALGVDRVKHASVAITGVKERTSVVCAGATFVTSGVSAGDVATISGASVTVPFKHDGQYLVDVVVSEEELVLRPHEDSGDVRELNPLAGTFGNLVVTSGGVWEFDLSVSFYPPIARFPPDGKIYLVVPVETPLGELSSSELLDGDVRSSADVAGWVLLQLWRNQSLDGVYQGMAGARGSGFHANVTARPLRVDAQHAVSTGIGTSVRTSTGTATFDAYTLRLTAAADDRFDVDDVGRTILLTSAGPEFLAGEPWVITRLIDTSTVELVPPLHRAGYRETDGTTVLVSGWDIRSGDAIDVYGLVHAVSPEFFGEADSDPAAGGFVFTREQRDTASTSAPVPGLLSFLHLERVRLRRGGTNITVTSVASTAADNVLTLSFDPESTSNIFGETYETHSGVLQGGITYVRVLTGVNAGLYRVKGVRSGTTSVTVEHLNGSAVTFTASASACQVAFYNAVAAVNAPVLGGPGGTSSSMASMALFQDGNEQGASFAIPLRIGWLGAGAGIYAYVNDPEMVAYDGGQGADGPLVQAVLSSPAEGIDLQMIGGDTGADNRRAGFGLRVRAHTSRHDLTLAGAPSAAGVRFDQSTGKGYAAYVAQTGDDPAQVVVKHAAASAGGESTAYSKLGPGAALLVGRAGASGVADLVGPTGRGSAAEVAGSVYVFRHDQGAGSSPAWAEGGVYSEGVVGGRWVYPIAGAYDFENSPYWGASSYDGWESPTQLGTPGQVYPPNDGDALQVADILLPDYDAFNYPHTAVALIADVTALSPALVPPFGRLVGCRFLVDDGAATYDGFEFAIVGAEVSAENRLRLALHSGTATLVGSDLARAFRILGQRFHEAHVNVGDYLMHGTSRERGTLQRAPVSVKLDGELLDELQRSVAAVSDGDLQTVVALGPYLWAGSTGSRIGLGGDFASLTAVDVTAAAYLAAVTWPSGGYYFVRHGWSVDSVEPRSPWPNVAFASMADTAAAATPTIGTGYKGSLLVDEVAVSLGVNYALTWSSKWGGCLHFNRTVGGSTTARLWRPGHTLVLKGHLSVRVSVILQVQDNKSVTLALRNGAGTALASSVISVTSSTTPQEVSAELTVFDEALYRDGAVGAVSGDVSTVAVYCTMDIGLQHTTDDVYILEFRSEQITRPTLHDGPQIVGGPVIAHGFRFTDPVKGFDTRGPADAEMLCGPYYGFASSSLKEVLDLYPEATLANIGLQEMDGQPGRIRANVDMGGMFWYQVVALRELFFAKGMHAAAITLVNGAYDPVFYIYNTCDATGVDPDVHAEDFQLPGRTGFVIQHDVPHGALMTHLSISLSFRPNYSAGDGDLHWGVFRAFAAEDTAATPATTPTAAQLLDPTAWDGAAGVYVELWRHNAVDMGISEENNANFSEVVPAYGFSERLCRFAVDLSGITPPTYEKNLVDQEFLPGVAHNNHIHAGSELQVRRSWDLLQAVAEADHQVLRADRRQYSYYVTVSFWGGPRTTGLVGEYAAYTYVDGLDSSTFPVVGTAATPSATSFKEPLVRVASSYPGEEGAAAYTGVDFPPQVKYRGSRLGYVTDRGAHGGWGQ